ncbi:Protein tyrosine kinase/Protein kinase domain containing protein, putative [Leishmania lindenbergi]|uniref:Protein kinase domain-containing protein n=1 Tax=Leishmania lindenbergi TaxID=651832 RepID=A0AAW3AHD9_9TRYP
MPTSTAGSAPHRQVIGNYELGCVLAMGDFDCRTRLCRHVTTGVPYVVRVYDKRVLAEAQWMWNRVAESIRVLRTLPKNKHVLEMVECFETSTSLYILMHLFQSMNVTKLFTDAAAREQLLRRLHTMSQSLARSSAASTLNDLPIKDSERPERGACYRAPSRLGALQAADMPSFTIPQGMAWIAPSATKAPKRVSSLRMEKSVWTSSAPAAEPQFLGRGAEASANANKAPLHGGEKQGSTTSTVASMVDSASTLLTAVAAISALDGAEVPSHVPLSLIRALFEQAVKGVLHLHQHNVAHTGIAPDHLLVGPDGLLRISNIVSCCFCAPGDRLRELRGTRHTVAPEVLRGESYDPYLADAWALGVALYFMLNRGRYPHDGASTLRHILHGHMRPSRPGLPSVALDLVSRLLQASPEERLPVDAILVHPFFSESLPTIAEEAAAEAAKTAELQAQHGCRSLTTGAATHRGHSVVNCGGDGSENMVGEDVAVAGTNRPATASLHWESLVSFRSGGSITGGDEVDSPWLNAHDGDAFSRKDGLRRSGRGTVRSPHAGLPRYGVSAALLSSSPSTARAQPVASSFVTTSPHDSVGGSKLGSLHPRWRPGLAPTLEALKDLAARVIQYHYRQVRHRQQYRAETRALVARSQAMSREKAKEEGSGGQQGALLGQSPAVVVVTTPLTLESASFPACTATPKQDELLRRQRQHQQHNLTLVRKVAVAPNVPQGAADSQSTVSARRRVAANSGTKTAGSLKNKLLPYQHKSRTAPPALTNQFTRMMEENGVVLCTHAGSYGSSDCDDNDDECSLISNLDAAQRANVVRGTGAVDPSATTAEANGTAARGSLKLPVPLRLNQRRPGSSVANAIVVAPHQPHLSSNSSMLPTLALPHSLRNSVGRSPDRARVVEGMTVKDAEACPLCHREPYMVRAIGIRPYAGTPYVYADGNFTKMLLV